MFLRFSISKTNMNYKFLLLTLFGLVLTLTYSSNVSMLGNNVVADDVILSSAVYAEVFSANFTTVEPVVTVITMSTMNLEKLSVPGQTNDTAIEMIPIFVVIMIVGVVVLGLFSIFSGELALIVGATLFVAAAAVTVLLLLG